MTRAPLFWRLGLPVALAALLVDQVTKAWALDALWPPYSPGIVVLPVLNLRLGFNTGVTFGMFAGGPASSVWILSGVALAVVTWLLVWMWRSTSRLEVPALGLIVGGAIGNVADRLRRGAVTDFLDAHYEGWHWPTFNMADVGIVCGVGMLLLATVRPAAAASRETPG
ncbi:signal peptidase II [Muricoccus radiodurans]|uniref:signal peptidase II n=1 Tax=Muricoccus radiodurans TaxID=2231721 RepID=UPI003CF11306